MPLLRIFLCAEVQRASQEFHHTCLQKHGYDNTYVQWSQIIVGFDHILYRLAYDADDPVNDMHNSISRHLVAVNDPGTVHSDNLQNC